MFIKGQCEHNHAPDVGILNTTKIMADVFKPASAIVDEVLLKQMDVAAPCPAQHSYLARNANYNHQQLRFKDPVALEFELQDEHLPPDFLLSAISVRGQCHLIFATASQLVQLKKAKNWYIDEKFKLCHKPFSQLVSINAFIKSNNHVNKVPLLYVMSGRSKRDYREVFLSVIDVLVSDPAVENYF